jgi:hypothetical protein
VSTCIFITVDAVTEVQQVHIAIDLNGQLLCKRKALLVRDRLGCQHGDVEVARGTGSAADL